MENLAGKTAVITGAASGIGLAMAHRFGAEGMRLMLADVEGGPLAEAERTLSAAGYQTASVEVDVRELEQMQALESAARDRFENVHVLCNNAGVGAGGPVSGLDDLEKWKWTIDVNLWGVIYGCKVFLPAMVEHGEPGHVVNTASMAGHAATPYMGAYNVSKFGVVALSETMSRELQIAGSAIGVSVLCPAFVATGIADSQRNMPPEVAASDPTEVDPEMQGVVQALVAAGMSPDDVASAVHDSVVTNNFWILTHPESKQAILNRADEIVNRTNPTPHIGFQ